MENTAMTENPIIDQEVKKRRFMPQWIHEANVIRKKEGIKGMLKKGGWRLLVAFFIFYLIRDTILYVIPLMLGANCLTEYFQ